MTSKITVGSVKNYLVERIEFLEEEYAFKEIDPEQTLTHYGEYLGLVKAFYDLFNEVY